jgi:hypothetical protein
MQQIDLHPGPFGRLTFRDIVVSLGIATVVLVLAPAVGLLVLLLIG